MPPAQVAAAAPVRDLAVRAKHMQRADDDEIGDEAREPCERDVTALGAVTWRDGARLDEFRRNPPVQHGERPEGEPLESVRAEDGADEFHAREYEGARGRSDCFL